VKCDETRPFCIKCTSTGRTCEGYVPPLPRKAKPRRSKYEVSQVPPERRGAITPIAPESLSRPVVSSRTYALHVPRRFNRAYDEVSSDEQRSLHYYRTHVSKGISGYFDADFWNSLVLQVGEEEPAVRHAIFALSALYEVGEMSQLLHPPSSTDRYDSRMRFAIYQYNTAIRTLLSMMSTTGPRVEVVLISCLIFTWIECLRGDVGDALRHLHSGLRILCEKQKVLGSRMVVKHTVRILGHVLIQASLHGISTLDFDYRAITNCIPVAGSLYFVTLGQAQCELNGKTNCALRFLRMIEDNSNLSRLKCMYQVHIQDLDRWKEAFACLTDRLDISTLDAGAVRAHYQVELCYLLISNTLDTLFATTPMIFDKYNHVYARMVYLCRQVLEDQILRRTRSVFTFPFDNGVQRALFYVVLRCRHLHIRREAAQLLELCPDGDSFWQRTSLIAFCNWKIGIEERGRPRGALETDPLPENARVYAEKAREVSSDGLTRVVIRFKRGALSGSSEDISDEEEVANASTRLPEVLVMCWPASSYLAAGTNNTPNVV
jgi:hypothetical protein